MGITNFDLRKLPGMFAAPRVKGTSNYNQTTVSINDFGLQRMDRTNKNTGATKSRFTVSIDATPLTHYCDAVSLGSGPANAIAEHLRARIRSTQAPATASTEARRESAARAFARGGAVQTTKKGKRSGAALSAVGAVSVMDRYSGGRIGAMAPNSAPGSKGRLFNDSGRFADSLIAKPARPTPGAQAKAQWIINVAANRLDPDTFGGGQAALSTMYIRLVELIPEWADPQKLMEVPSVKQAVLDSYKSILARNEDLRMKLGQAKMRVFRQALAVFR